MLEVQHTRGKRFEETRVIARCDACGTEVLGYRRMRTTANVDEARVIIRAFGWQVSGGKCYCPRHSKSGTARNGGEIR